MTTIEFTIQGIPPSKSNMYRIIQIRGHGSLAKTKEMKSYEASFAAQVPAGAKVRLSDPFSISVDVYYPSRRADLDNSLKGILDCLQRCEVITNDRLCEVIVARRFVDQAKPRCEIKIAQLQPSLF